MAAPWRLLAWLMQSCCKSNVKPAMISSQANNKLVLQWQVGKRYCSTHNTQTASSVAVAGRSSVSGAKIDTEEPTQVKVQKISKAMQAYLERADAHDKMMSEHIAEYELGKKHLARMMDMDVDTLTQEEIDQAIEYLLPSGLYSRFARPKMKHPEEIFPRRKAAEFDATGRPYHYLFYTGLPNYYELMHNILNKIESLDNLDAKAKKIEKSEALNLHGSQWLPLDKLKEMLIEEIDEHRHRRFIVLMERLCEHPFAYKEKEFIMSYRVDLPAVSHQQLLPEIVTEEETGKQYIETEGRRKRSYCKLKLWPHGTGKVTINGRDLSYFKDMAEREQIMSPLVYVHKLGAVDFECTVELGGVSSKAGAIRLALSLALSAFEDDDTKERMRQAGLLTKDVRRKERQKPGQRGAREKKTWKKR